MHRIAVLVIVLIVHGSLYPWQFRAPAESLNPFLALAQAWQPIRGRRLILDAAGNVAFYVPFGLALFVALRRRCGARCSTAATVLAAAVLSASMEMAQLFTVSRDCSASDFVFNVSGAALGVGLAVALGGRLGTAAFARQKGGSPEAVLLLGCWVGWQLFPFMPETGRLALMAKAAAMFHPAGFPWVQAAVAAAEWIAVSRLANLAAGCRHARWVFLLLFFTLLAKPFMVGRTVTWPEVAGAAAAAVLWRGMAAPWCAPVLLAGAVVLRGLEPFRFAAVRPRFHWVPFEVFIAADWDFAAALLARKIFWYGGIIWLCRAAGVRVATATGAVFLLLAGIEACQMVIPGHVPETTDPALALLIGLVFLWMGRDKAGNIP